MSEGGWSLSRRALLRAGGMAAVGLFVTGGRDASFVPAAVPVRVGAPRFLTANEMATLRALVDRFVPGPPEDPDPGALDAGCADAIDALLAAFQTDPPQIYAGAPFSDRGGAARNDFQNFLPLDDYEQTAWRLRIEGSRGQPHLEFNGPVRGFQEIYRDGLAALDGAAGPLGFAALPGPARDLVLATANDPAVTALVDVAFPHTLEFMYGAPEYGGNRDLVGWDFTNFDGDVQPRGYTREQVENPDQPGLADLLRQLPVALPQLLAVAPLASPEILHGLITRSGGVLGALRAEVAAILDVDLADVVGGALEDARDTVTAAIEEQRHGS